jgi:hypothetical protein
MPIYTIASTRQGFYYQDLYAILRFLTAYEENRREIVGFFVDFGYDTVNDKSDDVLMRFRQPDDVIYSELYDIKTGDSFRRNKGEVLKVVGEFISRRKQGTIPPGDTTRVVVSHDTGRALVALRTHTDSLRLGYETTHKDVVKNAIDYFKTHVPADYYNDADDLYESLKLIDFIPAAPPLNVISGEAMNDVRYTICAKIEVIAGKLGIENPNYNAFPKDILINDMLSIIQSSAGSNKNIVQPLKAAMENYYARCKTETPYMESGESGGLNKALTAVRKVMSEFEASRPNPEVAPDQQVEGGVVS